MGAHYATRCLKEVVVGWWRRGGRHQRELVEQCNLIDNAFQEFMVKHSAAIGWGVAGTWFMTATVTRNKRLSRISNDENTLLERGCGGS